MAVMQSAVAYFQDKIVVRHAASIIHTARLYCFVRSSESVTPLEESFLRFAAKLFTESSDKTWILCILETLSTFIASRLHSLAKGQKPFPEIPALRSSVLALLLCEDELHNSVDARRLADFAGYLNHSAALAAKRIEAFPGSHYSMEEVKQSAREDQAAVQRASQLRGILSSPSEIEGSGHMYMSRSRDRDAAEEEALNKGLGAGRASSPSTVDQGARRLHGKQATSKFANKRMMYLAGDKIWIWIVKRSDDGASYRRIQ
ncbi:hypothetical protein KFL_000810220 [Klebsormidium nitens]|uniref:Uncharacterized protein n=1 Tax=Klebsormidium nitens TaxID=105231 RepID=A0A1Y1HS74_KLENI|nr:hypothetical protein KFL_000810220 [Klebsormidium nitens]|eukprot:GAQ81480.1 hypothetical protein KFL_000810220 [Klebsormidium nitens]